MSTIFVVWVLFFDSNDFISQYKDSSKLRQLGKDKQYYIDEINKTKADLDEILGTTEKIEKFAREKYLMKKDNEDVFVVVD